MFTQYMNNPLLINPSYAGSYGDLNFSGIFRKQWVGFDWQPTTTTFSIHSPFRNYKVGIGATFINDKIGPVQQTGIYFDYAYHIIFGNNAHLSLGLKTGFNYYQKDLYNLIMSDPIDKWIEMNPLSSKFMFNTGVGGYYYTEKYFVGFSIPKLIRNSFSDKDDTYQLVGKEERHMFFTGGGIFKVNSILKIKPSTMIRVVNGSPASVEITGTAILYDKFWMGLMYRFQDAVAVHVRMQVNPRFQLAYSYDLTNSRLRSYNFGSHEIFVSYTFTKKGQRILSPRYF